MRKLTTLFCIFMAFAFTIYAVLSAIDGRNVLQSVHRDQSRSAFNEGVTSNGCLALLFAGIASALIFGKTRPSK